MNFPSIDIQGSILSTDILSKIRSEQISFQLGKDFNADFTNARLKDEISLAWQEAKGQWTIFKSKLGRLREGETGTTETRNFWIFPLLTNLGYNLTYSRQSDELNGKMFPIGYRDNTLDNFPVYIGGYYELLDRRPENKQLRVSPHALLQEYLNYSEHLYGIVTNGRQLRLLRDASRITRLSYVEFNLEKMLEEDLYSDFVIFYRLLHASRVPRKIDGGQESILEYYHQEGLAAGSTIRSNLGKAVRGAILTLANGFINHPGNTVLRQTITSGDFDENEYYRYQLRIIYRLLFLFVIEERNLVYSDSKTPETRRFSQIYFNYYSLQRLRKLAKKLPPPEANRHFDLWRGLVSTFSLFEDNEIGRKLGIMSLRGDLFGYESISNTRYDLHQCYLSNAILLNIIRALTYFENENKTTLIAVNYGGLDVEEFGSVYEGLLELQLTVRKVEGSELYSCGFGSSNERSKSGSHYTPEELVQPLIKHSLEHLIEDRTKAYYQKRATKDITIQSLLSLKICDVACGSGHILLSAGRRVALEIAKIKTDEEQPNPLSIRQAMKDVVRNCIYGVDRNPLAVELCKIALWLEAYNPGEPLNFLDHHIKCGDAIVGLAHRGELDNGIPDEAFAALPVDDKAIAKLFKGKNTKERKVRKSSGSGQQLRLGEQLDSSVQEAMAEYKVFSLLAETTPEEIERKAKAYRQFIDSRGFTFLKRMADTQVAQFFIPKTRENQDFLMTDEDFRLILSGYQSGQDRKIANATVVAFDHRFFHWFIEFPEVFNEGGFDCILGNPPFLGGLKISTHYGSNFLTWLHYAYKNANGTCDLVAYFFRRIFSLISPKGFMSLISTNTISQGDTRTGGIDFIINNGGIINHAVKSMKWPGVAAVDISLISITRSSKNFGRAYLNSKPVSHINSFLSDAAGLQTATQLKRNISKSFIGSNLLGVGFIPENKFVDSVLTNYPEYKTVLYPYLSGDDLNNEPDQNAKRFVINFHDFPLGRYSAEEWAQLDKNIKQKIEKAVLNKSFVHFAPPAYGLPVASDFPLCLEMVEQKVKPERDLVNDKVVREKWWLYERQRKELYASISVNNRAYAISRVTKHCLVSPVPQGIVYSMATVVFCISNIEAIFINSALHDSWCWYYGSTMGTGTLRYTPSDCFETFPFPSDLGSRQKENLETISEIYFEHRKRLMEGMQLGLTRTYNLLHSNAILQKDIHEKDKQVLALQNHLDKTANTISFDAAIQALVKLRDLHIQIDTSTLEAYGWGDIALQHDFYPVDYLPENDRIRFTIHPDAKRELLKRLLDLNHKLHAEEGAKGLVKS